MPLEKLSEFFRGKTDLVNQEEETEESMHTDEMPAVPHKVLWTGLPFYTDAECTQQVPDANITILQALSGTPSEPLDIVPSTNSYEVGQYLTWRLNKENLWEECYFRNPESGQVEKAWTMHVEFVGQIISEEAVEKDRQRLQELEAQHEVERTTV